MIKYANGIALVVILILAFGLLVDSGHRVQAYTKDPCPAVQNDPSSPCLNRQYVDVGYYGCSHSETIPCCTYDYANVYCMEGYPTLPPTYLGTAEILAGTSYTTSCYQGKCQNPPSES